ncbi:MAG: response regulator transcription factor [Lachnospiraceae bacterium]|nr:response regulator transcription factor [Lachnospiraceae bacterium]
MGIEVMITDDHKMVREGIKQLLELNNFISVVGMAADGMECISLLKEKEADVLLLDINMPNMNGLETLKEIKEFNSKVKVIFLTVHNEVDYLLRAVEMGADGYVLKDSGSAELVNAIQMVMDGESYIQPDMIPMLNSKMVVRNSDREKIKNLTKRELEVLVLVSEGMFNKEIADQLSISERTVKNHISSIFKKIDVSDRTQAAVFAIRNSLIHI